MTRLVLKSNFKAAKKAGHDALEELVREATEKMHETAADRLDKAAGQRGYNLFGTDISFDVNELDGKIEYPHFYGRFFEMGTTHIQAMPFMRPGHRAGRKYVTQEAPDVFEKWLRRKAQVR